jgi:hypothetical protein
MKERGIPNKNAPPLPSPFLHFVEERCNVTGYFVDGVTV